MTNDDIHSLSQVAALRVVVSENNFSPNLPIVFCQFSATLLVAYGYS